MGYLVPQDGEQYVPVTAFGHALTDPSDRDTAQSALDADGLSVLADRWLLDLEGRDGPIVVRIAAMTPDHVTVRNADYGHEGDIGTPFVLEVPVDGRLRPER